MPEVYAKGRQEVAGGRQKASLLPSQAPHLDLMEVCRIHCPTWDDVPSHTRMVCVEHSYALLMAVWFAAYPKNSTARSQMIPQVQLEVPRQSVSTV